LGFARFSHFYIREIFAFFRESDKSEILRKKRKFSLFSLANEMRKNAKFSTKKKSHPCWNPSTELLLEKE